MESQSMKNVCIWALMLGLSLGLVSREARAQAEAAPVPTALREYVEIPDPTFSWKLNGKTELALGQVYDIELVSQTWMDMPWKHVFIIYEPKVIVHHEHVLLFITGGSHLNKPNEENQQLGLVLANLTGARIAMLHQVPNQPLLGGRTEDDLITDTMLFYLATGDKRWPLLFPMVKAAVKAMDTVEQVAAQEWKRPVKGFVVTGASKRGWTTWLTGATDKRVLGIAPLVIDNLNLEKQMAYQIASWGKYSEQIADYTRKGLVEPVKGDMRRDLLALWIDPYQYRSELTMPKLIVNGTNDRYWTVDALNNYWDDLKGAKYIRYVPNAGHNLKGGREGAMATLAAFFRQVVSNKPMPVLEWQHATLENKFQLKIKSSGDPTGAKLWVASSETKDFRNSEWKPLMLEGSNGEYLGELEKPQSGHVALFGEVQYQIGPIEYTLSTQLRRE